MGSGKVNLEFKKLAVTAYLLNYSKIKLWNIKKIGNYFELPPFVLTEQKGQTRLQKWISQRRDTHGLMGIKATTVAFSRNLFDTILKTGGPDGSVATSWTLKTLNVQTI